MSSEDAAKEFMTLFVEEGISMKPFYELFRQITSECRQVGKLRWNEVFSRHGLTSEDIEMIKREDLERQHWGSGY